MDRRQFLTATAGIATAGMAASLAAPSIALGRGKNIVELAVATPQLSTLVAAVQAAGLVDALSAPGTMTVFAPTDDAFARLPAGTVERLLMPDNKDKLTAVLTYHVSGSYYPARALLGQRGRVPTLQGGFLGVDATGDSVKINRSAMVTAPDIMASNGVVHLIDNVLLPSM